MAELPNRMDLEADFNRRLSRLSARHRRELRELLGTPPDPRNVPDEFWRRVEDERNAEMLLLLLLITQESQRLHVGELLPDALQDLPADALASVARDWSGRRAASVAAGNVAKARERLAVRADFWRNFGGAVPSEQLEGDLVDVFGPRMDAATAATETTSAQTAGANGAIGAAEAFGYRVATRWYTRKDDRVCPVCAPLHGKHVDLWELVLRNVVAPGGTRAIESIALNGGPPAHPSCRCYVTTKVEAPARRVRTGAMAEATREDVRWVTIDDHPVPIVNGEIALPKDGKKMQEKPKAKVFSTTADAVEMQADLYEKKHGWKDGRTREGFVANWKKKLAGTEPTEEQAKRITDGIQNAIDSYGVESVPVVIRKSIEGDSTGEGAHWDGGFVVFQAEMFNPGSELSRRPLDSQRLISVETAYENDITGLYIHELGHKNHEDNPDVENRARLVLADEEGKAKAAKLISRYAVRNAKELSAEAFAMSRHKKFDALPQETRDFVNGILIGKKSGD